MPCVCYIFIQEIILTLMELKVWTIQPENSHSTQTNNNKLVELLNFKKMENQANLSLFAGMRFCKF